MDPCQQCCQSSVINDPSYADLCSSSGNNQAQSNEFMSILTQDVLQPAYSAFANAAVTAVGQINAGWGETVSDTLLGN